MSQHGDMTFPTPWDVSPVFPDGDEYLPGSEDPTNFLHRCRGSCASSSEDPRIGEPKKVSWKGQIRGKLCSPNSRIVRGVESQWEKMASFLKYFPET